MSLTEGQKKYLIVLCKTLSIESLLKLKKGNIEGIKDFNTYLIDPNLIREHKEMLNIINNEIRKRRI